MEAVAIIGAVVTAAAFCTLAGWIGYSEGWDKGCMDGVRQEGNLLRAQAVRLGFAKWIATGAEGKTSFEWNEPVEPVKPEYPPLSPKGVS